MCVEVAVVGGGMCCVWVARWCLCSVVLLAVGGSLVRAVCDAVYGAWCCWWLMDTVVLLCAAAGCVCVCVLFAEWCRRVWVGVVYCMCRLLRLQFHWSRVVVRWCVLFGGGWFVWCCGLLFGMWYVRFVCVCCRCVWRCCGWCASRLTLCADGCRGLMLCVACCGLMCVGVRGCCWLLVAGGWLLPFVSRRVLVGAAWCVVSVLVAVRGWLLLCVCRCVGVVCWVWLVCVGGCCVAMVVCV